MASNFTALYDACVLYPAPLRDLLMQLALTDLFRARWTEQIHDEWIRNLLKKRPDLTLQQLTRTKELMNSHVRDCLVTNYEYLIPSLELPDPDDRHVLAAAIQGNADVIVTTNLSDFPSSVIRKTNETSARAFSTILNFVYICIVLVESVTSNQKKTPLGK